MKTCPTCGARAFDDAEVCFGCLHRYGESPSSERRDADDAVVAWNGALSDASSQGGSRSSRNLLRKRRRATGRGGPFGSSCRDMRP